MALLSLLDWRIATTFSECGCGWSWRLIARQVSIQTQLLRGSSKSVTVTLRGSSISVCIHSICISVQSIKQPIRLFWRGFRARVEQCWAAAVREGLCGLAMALPPLAKDLGRE